MSYLFSFKCLILSEVIFVYSQERGFNFKNSEQKKKEKKKKKCEK